MCTVHYMSHATYQTCTKTATVSVCRVCPFVSRRGTQQNRKLKLNEETETEIQNTCCYKTIRSWNLVTICLFMICNL